MKDKKKVANRKMSSIARKIHRAWSWRLLRACLVIDFLVILLAVTGFCYAAEVSALGAPAGDVARDISVREEDRAFLKRAIKARDMGEAFELLRIDNWRALAHGATYRFMDGRGAWHEASLALFLDAFDRMFGYLLAGECAYWLLHRLFGTGGARRVLRPLTKMTETAQQLSQRPTEAPKRAPDKLHDLEDAISSIVPSGETVRLFTGDQELKGLEEAINNLLERMQAAYADQARFVSDASHELRTPIAVIQGYVNMLDRWGKQDESILDESIGAIKAETAHMKMLIEQLLFLARGDSGRQPLALAPFDVCELLREVREEYGMIDQGHTWEVDAPAMCMITADEALIKQAVRILTDNARKYTPAGGTIALRAFARKGETCVSVQDSGAGIEKEAAPHIFERFYRADPARAGKSGGTGLGLAIAQWIVERHGGYFEVLSWPELGTRVTLCLPACAGEESPK
ncbi:MAG: ATP-binding protein [Clostridia bacterium]